jgi:hypothetical protein
MHTHTRIRLYAHSLARRLGSIHTRVARGVSGEQSQRSRGFPGMAVCVCVFAHLLCVSEYVNSEMGV